MERLVAPTRVRQLSNGCSMSEGGEIRKTSAARCRVRYARVWHSVRLTHLSFTNASIEFSGRVAADTRMEVAVHGIEPRIAYVTNVEEGQIHLMFEDPIPWSDLTQWTRAAHR
ncbi:hypothetical protein K9B35_00180 [Sphingomonas sp. R647]|uniref:hypothetical protein n=1 Tax=Sphingomonas sp. R647 TaxID=2875233 RepID=UPI001CD6381D|nr:hypothetical protein [Sphingomonas sp. R647]MCA1196371.1 hypothetical protein [Sphingomonas sp. R647]